MAVTVGNCTITLDSAHLAARMKAGAEAAAMAVADKIKGDSEKYLPFREGDLSSSGRVEQVEEDWAVTWNTVYAAYQYYGCWPDGSHQIHNHNTDTHPDATTQWVEAARAEKLEEWQAVAQAAHAKASEGA